VVHHLPSASHGLVLTVPEDTSSPAQQQTRPPGRGRSYSRLMDPFEDCFVCDKHTRGDEVPGGVIYDDGIVYAGHTHPMATADAALGYLMVEPRRHVPRLGDLTDEEASSMGVVANRLSRVLRTTLGAEHVYSFVFGDRVPHLHVHLAPRYPNAPEEVFGLGATGIQHSPDVPRGGPSEIQDVCDRLRAALP